MITIPYKPREHQLEVHGDCESHRFGVVVAHRRFGKSVLFANHLQRSALRTEKNAWRGAFIGPTYTQAKAILWDHLKHYSKVVRDAHLVTYNESELRLDYGNGSRVRIFGADNPDALRGLYFDEVVFDEFDLCKMSVWSEVVRPALADRKGNGYFIGTFKGVDGPLGQIYDLAGETEGWFRRIYPASETGVLDDEELAAARSAMSIEEYNREFECVRSAAVRGAIFGRLIDEADAEGRITRVPYDERLPVTTAWDLGVGDSTAIWFCQRVGGEVRLIDYYINEGEGLPHYAKVLQDKGYVYGEHIAPHDINVRELGTGRSRLEIAGSLGIRFRVLPRISQKLQSELDERIEAGRTLLPRCWFDSEHCKRGIDALRSWKREENIKTGELNARPVHDWASHGADALTYLAMGLREGGKVNRPTIDHRWVV